MLVCNVNKLISAYISTLQGAVFNTDWELALEHEACGVQHISPVTNWTSRYKLVPLGTWVDCMWVDQQIQMREVVKYYWK